MKAAVIEKYGKPDIFHIQTVSEPTPLGNEIKVHVAASSVNPIDCKTRSGSIAFLSGWKFPRILGSDFSGVVTACGLEVKHLKPGDEVFGFSPGASKAGAYGEFICCDATRAAVKPVQLPAEQAAAIPLAGLTAYKSLYREGRMQPGMRILITGATGGVGHFAVQIAKAAGCHVTGVCHSRNKELATQLGCDEVMPYDEIDFRRNEQRYNLIFDSVAKYGYRSCRPILTAKGTYVSTIPYPSVMVMHLISSHSKGRRGRFISVKATTADLEKLAQLADAGTLAPHIEHVFQLADISKAHILSETEKTRGKIIIEI